MQIGYIGLGKMGLNMVLRLLEKGHDVIAYNRSPESVEKAVEAGAKGTTSITELYNQLNSSSENSSEKIIWIMVPHTAVDDVIAQLKPSLQKGDIVIDGGNSFYKDSMRRAKELEELGVEYLDVGVSGGPKGAREGASIMIGGKGEILAKVESLFEDLAVPNGCAHVGKSGAGHFVKMVHNGIEYGMMQAIAEGFDILKKSDFDLSLREVLKPYRHGSVIESRLLDWLDSGLEECGENLEKVSGSAAASGEGKWTADTAEEMSIAAEVIEDAVEAREISQESPNYQGKIVSIIRGKFGGHPITKIPLEDSKK